MFIKLQGVPINIRIKRRIRNWLCKELALCYLISMIKIKLHLLENIWCYGNASTRKCLNTESGPKKTETSPKWIFLRRFLFYQKLSEIPQIQFLEEFPVFFDPFPRFLGRIPVYQGLILLRDFPIFLIRFLIFWVRFRFSEKV